MTPTAFYCVSDARYFLGAVGLVNSLRLVGHTEPVYVLDCGLTADQRALLEPHATLVRDDSGTPPWLLKTIAPLRHPASTMVLIDADMIVTRRLDEVIARARGGRVVAFDHGSDRHVPEWGELLGLGPVRRQTYVCSGFVATPREHGEPLLRELDQLQDHVDIERTWFGVRDLEYPFLFPEQDILNALLASRLPADRLEVLERRLEPIPPFEGVRVVSVDELRCVTAAGDEPYLLHHFAAKPWLDITPEGPYTQLLRRLLNADDLAIRVPRREVPLRLRRGALGQALRERASGSTKFEAYLRDPVARAAARVRAKQS